MKKFFLLLFLISSQATAAKLNSEFYEPNVDNNYQGRLFYNSFNESYPIDKMRKLCESFTGVDTAQIKCFERNKKNTVICEYKCSMHWITDK